MLKKIKKIISRADLFFYQKFGSHKSLKVLENINEARILFSHINETGQESRIRFVGGCVRKALNGESIDDIDLATFLKPNEIKDILNKNNIRVIDTGISHGTVTAILNNNKFEITTLRKDISTDGRHANVEFTSDWEQDAQRRDFTINAIYGDIDGRIFDPQNGVSDLQNGRIKFIGVPEERIQEDYLRILRYFRFFIQYSKVKYDQSIIQSIKKNINGLNKISNERIFSELEKIFKLQSVYSLFSHEQFKEIILNIFPQFKYSKRLNVIKSLNKKLMNNYDNHLILGILIVDESNDYEYFCHKFKVSNSIKNRYKNISENLEKIKSKKFYTKENIRKLIYLMGRDKVKDLLLFSICFKNIRDISNIEKLIYFTDICKIPTFPISGDYLKEQGYKTGRELGRKLKLLEENWIENEFVVNKKFVEKILKKIDNN